MGLWLARGRPPVDRSTGLAHPQLQNMNTFEEYQRAATQTPLSLRNNRDRIDLPVRGLQQEAGKVGSLLASAFACGRLVLTPEQVGELKDRLSEMLWCIALLCRETGVPMQELAAHSLAQLQSRVQSVDPNQR